MAVGASIGGQGEGRVSRVWRVSPIGERENVNVTIKGERSEQTRETHQTPLGWALLFRRHALRACEALALLARMPRRRQEHLTSYHVLTPLNHLNTNDIA